MGVPKKCTLIAITLITQLSSASQSVQVVATSERGSGLQNLGSGFSHRRRLPPGIMRRASAPGPRAL